MFSRLGCLIVGFVLAVILVIAGIMTIPAFASSDGGPGPNIPLYYGVSGHNGNLNTADQSNILKIQKLVGNTAAYQTGKFGSVTTTNVKKWQAAHGLSQTGVVSNYTWPRMFGGYVPLYYGLSGSNGVATVGVNYTADVANIKLIQGKVGVTADGHFGAGTRDAVKRWQLAHGLSQTGVVSQYTWGRMFDAPPASGYVGRVAADPAVWTNVFQDDFPTAAAKGSFLSTYPLWTGYPSNYTTTDDSGRYDPNQVSVSGGVMNVALTPGSPGNNLSAAMYPKESRHLGMRVSQRMRITNRAADWHIANLLWPTSGVWPGDGEIDYAEGGLDSDDISLFMHRQNGTSGGDQSYINKTLDLTQWHTITVEWLAGQSCKWFVDGVQVGSTITSRVPSTTMRLVMQIESSGSPTQASNVQYDWVTIDYPK